MTAPVQAPSLLADPANVALLRDLYAHARHVKALHNTTAYTNPDGRPYGGWEHLWITDTDVVSIEDGKLTYKRDGVKLLTAQVSDLRQAVDVIVDMRALPVWFSSAYNAGREDAGWTGGAR